MTYPTLSEPTVAQIAALTLLRLAMAACLDATVSHTEKRARLDACHQAWSNAEDYDVLDRLDSSEVKNLNELLRK